MTFNKPLWLQAGSYPGAYDRRLIGAIWPTAAVQGCAVSASSAMNMNIAPGTVVAPTANNTGSVLCYSDAVEVVTATAAPASGQSRIDLVVCQPRGNDLDGGTKNDCVLAVVAGVAATPGSQVAPAVPVGAVALAQVAIAGGSAAIVAGNITDRRVASPAGPGGTVAGGAGVADRQQRRSVGRPGRVLRGTVAQKARDKSCTASCTDEAGMNSNVGAPAALPFDSVIWRLRHVPSGWDVHHPRIRPVSSELYGFDQHVIEHRDRNHDPQQQRVGIGRSRWG